MKWSFKESLKKTWFISKSIAEAELHNHLLFYIFQHASFVKVQWPLHLSGVNYNKYRYITNSDSAVRNEQSGSFVPEEKMGGGLRWACWMGCGVDGHTGKVISIHHCLLLSDSESAVTDEGDTIMGETVKARWNTWAWKGKGWAPVHWNQWQSWDINF